MPNHGREAEIWLEYANVLRSVKSDLFIYQLFWTQAWPEGMCTKGTKALYEVPSLTTGFYDPYSFRIVMWVLLRPTRTNQWNCCERGHTVFCPYPRRLSRKSNYLQMSLQRQHFLLSYLKTLSVGPAGV